MTILPLQQNPTMYPDSEKNPSIPPLLFDNLTVTAYVDSEHANDKLMHCSITGLLIFVDYIHEFHMSKCQGAIETSPPMVQNFLQ